MDSSGLTATAPEERTAAPPHPASETSPAARPKLWLAVFTLWTREVRAFYRQRSRVLGGLLTPLVFWLVLGSGFGSSLREAAGGVDYLNYFFPGAVALVVLFASIFANMSLIEDRREGFLLSVLVAPASRSAIVLGKILGATTIGAFQGALFLPLAPLAGYSVEWSRVPAAAAAVLVMAFGLTSLGFCFAWWLNSVQGFHSVMNVLLMPMWMLSGAVFPLEGAAAWVRWATYANPLSYNIAALRGALHPEGAALLASLPAAWAVSLIFAAATFTLAVWQVSRPGLKNLS